MSADQIAAQAQAAAVAQAQLAAAGGGTGAAIMPTAQQVASPGAVVAAPVTIPVASPVVVPTTVQTVATTPPVAAVATVDPAKALADAQALVAAAAAAAQQAAQQQAADAAAAQQQAADAAQQAAAQQAADAAAQQAAAQQAAAAAPPATNMVEQSLQPVAATATLPSISVQSLQVVPDYLKAAGTQGLDVVSQVVRPPAIRLVQAKSEGLKEAFPHLVDNDIVMLPAGIKVGDASNPLKVTPVYAYREWLCYNPRKVAGLDAVRGRSFDPTGEYAVKAKARTTDVCPEAPAEKQNQEEWQLSYSERMVFIVWAHDYNLAVAVSFAKGEYKYGCNFAALVKTRGASLWAGIYNLSVGTHVSKDKLNRWPGLDASNHPETPWVSPEQAAAFAEEYQLLKEAHETATLVPEGADDDEDVSTVPNGEGTSF